MLSSRRLPRWRRFRTWVVLAAATALAVPTVALTSSTSASAHPGHEADEGFQVLVFSKTAGFRHDSIEAGVAAIEQLGAENGFEVTATEDAGAFTEENLAGYGAVLWLSTTGDVLDDAQQAAFEAYIEGGGGYAGVHAASDTEYEWEWYGDLVGAYFDNHPPGTAAADVQVTDAHHPSTAHLPGRWNRTDEWYSFRENPRGEVHVLATLDEGSYEGGTMGADHPIAWCQDMAEGRSWYTGGGHTAESYADPEFLQHLLGGIRTAAGAADADCGATVDSSFEQVTLAKGADKTGEPIAMAVLPDGDVLHTSRDGRVWMTTSTATTTLAGRIPVYTHDEDGLQGVAIDPDFAENRWVYLYYAPPLDTPAGDAPEFGTAADFEPFQGHNQLSRYRLGDDGQLDLESEQEILQVPADRGTCCHAGGEIDFDGDGNLWLSTGDDTNPFASDGYTPIDERPDRNPAWDARRSSANTNDLRGKLIRIDVAEDGTYTSPEGNLFPESEDADDKTRPEIYAMGFRNPFRFSVDDQTGWVHLGDYGPDAGAANEARGPAGTVEFNLVKEPGNYGWPLCVGENQPFRDYDFATGESGPAFDCANPVNDSRHNTGLTELPPAIPAWLPYDGGSVPELGTGGESPMGAVVYDYDADLDSETKWPEYWDGKALMYEWDRAWIKEARLDETGALQSISPTLEWMDLRRPMNLEFGPDGSLYVLDYGGGYFGGDAQSAVYRIDYVKGSRSPQATIEASPTSGATPLEVSFDGSGSSHPEGLDFTYAWDFDGDGTTDSTEPTGSFTYTEPGQYTARLVLTDSEGREGFATTTITAGNTAPTVELRIPENGSFFGFGDQVPFEVVVTDPEDGAAVDCSRVTVEYILGHDNHGHPLSRETGCEGTITTVADEGHGLDANIFGVINASYTDGGAEGVPALTSDDEAILHTRTKQAEYATTLEGLDVLDKAGAVGGRQLGNIEPGDWFAYDPMTLTNMTSVSARYSSGGTGGELEVRVGAQDGPVAATMELPSTGSWETHEQSAAAEISASADAEGSALYFVATGPDAEQAVFDVDQLVFSGKGAASNAAPEIRSMSVTPETGSAPLDVTGTAEAVDPDGGDVTYAWDFDGDGETDSTEATATHTYDEGGDQTVTLTVTDDQGATVSAERTISVYAGLPCEGERTPGPQDEFDGDALDGCRWEVARHRPDLLSVADGFLTLTTTDADMYGESPDEVPNVVTTDQPEGEQWTVETKVRAAFGVPYQQGGLVVHADDANYVKLDVLATDGGLVTELRSEVDDVVQQPQPQSAVFEATQYGEYLLRLTRDGDTFSGQFSLDNGETWQSVGDSVTNLAVGEAGVGVYALGEGAGDQQIPVGFDYVRTVDAGPEPEPCEPTEPAEGYRALFDGTAESLAQWRMAGPGEMVLREDCTMETVGGMGLLWHPDELEDYSLTLDWKMQGDDNSGVFVGFPDPGDDPWVAVNEGYEVQIDATDEPDRTTGAIYTFQGADPEAVEQALNPPGEWNAYEIRKVGQTITVVLNGVTVNEFTSTERDISTGHIGLQNHGADDTVWFRDVQVKDLEGSEPVDPQTTTTTATAPAQSRYGSTPNVRVRVQGAEEIPSGEVLVEEGGRELARATLDDRGRAVVPVEGLSPGNHALRVRYLGEAGVSEGSRSTVVRHRVVKARSETSVTVQPTRLTTSTEPRVTARIAAPVDVSGYARVTVRRVGDGDVRPVVTRQARVADGEATWTLPALGAGRWRIEVVYAGSGTVESSTRATTVQVQR